MPCDGYLPHPDVFRADEAGSHHSHPRVTPAHVAVIRAVAAQDPRTLGLPGGRWSRSTLARYLTEERGIAIKRSRLHDILRIAGISLTEPSGAEHDLVGLPAPGDL